jgi:hypothetical protein
MDIGIFFTNPKTGWTVGEADTILYIINAGVTSEYAKMLV